MGRKKYKLDLKYVLSSKKTVKAVRRLIKISILLSVLIALGLGATQLYIYCKTSDNFKIKYWVVNGVDNEMKDKILKELHNIKKSINLNIVSFPYANVNKQLLVALPELGTIKFVRYLPDKVVINTKQRIPLAWIENKTRGCGIDSMSQIFEIKSVEGLPKVISRDRLDLTIDFLNHIKIYNPNWYHRIVTVGYDKAGYIKFYTKDGYEVIWGNLIKDEQSDKRFKALSLIIEDLKKNKVGQQRIDCRPFPRGGIVVRSI